MEKCQYDDCGMDVWGGSEKEKCIFHDQSPDKSRKKFIVNLKRKLKGKTPGKPFEFTGYHFPNSDAISFPHILQEILGKKAFPEDVIFFKTEFHSPAVFNGVTFEGEVKFSNVTVEGAAQFGGTKFQKLNTDKYGATVQFDGCDFSTTSFQGATFDQEVRIWGSSLGGRADFRSVSFLRKVDFLQVDVVSYFDFTDTSFAYPHDQEEVCKMARRTCENHGYEDKANEHHRYEMIGRHRQLGPSLYADGWEFDFWSFSSWIEALRRVNWKSWEDFSQLPSLALHKFVGLSTGYGEKWTDPLKAWAFVIFGFWLIYLPPGSLEPTNMYSTSEVGVLEKLYFSIVTFTTLGYGDIKPTGIIWQLLAGFESIFGGILMAAFVLVLGQKYLRS